MAHIIRIEDQFYISVKSALADDRTRVLKHGETFSVLDRYGDIQSMAQGAHGLYHDGTRFLSLLQLDLGKDHPMFLSSTVREDNALLTVDLTNPDIYDGGELVVPRGMLHLFRSKLLWEAVFYEQIRICNYGQLPVTIPISVKFGADYADTFEVRGTKRPRRGQLHREEVQRNEVLLSYEGLDRVVRWTRLTFSPVPDCLSGSQAVWNLTLEPRAEAILMLTVACSVGRSVARVLPYDEASQQASSMLKAAMAKDCHLLTSNEQFNEWAHRSLADLHMMITETPNGPYPYAGVPWFNTAFGRDGIITALAYLWVNPEIAQGVLRFLAATQARELNEQQDAEPGKIVHECRGGEMAALGEVPFARYYGSVDATALFVVLASEYYRCTGDVALIKSIWPNIELALEWLDRYGDLDGDGFIEYACRSEKGLINQGWKDSHDSVFHEDGSLAEGPIALCEPQAYAFAARTGAAELARAMGKPDRAKQLLEQASALKSRFEATFWSEALGSYVLALDGKKRPCQVASSNGGHALFAGITGPSRAKRLARFLLSEDLYSGWGIRTVGMSAPRYNPMSYHNGSVWPHDNALIAAGLARYGLKEGTLKLLAGLAEASLFFDLHRMPELFCGFVRRPGEGPTLYPVACAPQAWASAAPFMLLQACLGLSILGRPGELRFFYPVLPEFLEEVQIAGLRVGEGVVDLVLKWHPGGDVGINVTRREGDVKVVVIK